MKFGFYGLQFLCWLCGIQFLCPFVRLEDDFSRYLNTVSGNRLISFFLLTLQCYNFMIFNVGVSCF